MDPKREASGAAGSGGPADVKPVADMSCYTPAISGVCASPLPLRPQKFLLLRLLLPQSCTHVAAAPVMWLLLRLWPQFLLKATEGWTLDLFRYRSYFTRFQSNSRLQNISLTGSAKTHCRMSLPNDCPRRTRKNH